MKTNHREWSTEWVPMFYEAKGSFCAEVLLLLLFLWLLSCLLTMKAKKKKHLC